MTNKRIHIEKKIKYIPRKLEGSKIEREREKRKKRHRNLYAKSFMVFSFVFLFRLLAYRFRLFTFLSSNCDRSERLFSTELKSLNEQNRPFLQIYSQFECINMSPLSNNTKLNRQQKKEQSLKITFLDLNLFNYSFSWQKKGRPWLSNNQIHWMVNDLNLNWKFMDKKGLMAHASWAMGIQGQRKYYNISNRTVARKIKI